MKAMELLRTYVQEPTFCEPYGSDMGESAFLYVSFLRHSN